MNLIEPALAGPDSGVNSKSDNGKNRAVYSIHEHYELVISELIFALSSA